MYSRNRTENTRSGGANKHWEPSTKLFRFLPGHISTVLREMCVNVWLRQEEKKTRATLPSSPLSPQGHIHVFITATAPRPPAPRCSPNLLLCTRAVIDERLLTNNNSALHLACGNGHLGAVRALVDASAAVNAGNSYGNAPIHAALIGGHRAVR